MDVLGLWPQIVRGTALPPPGHLIKEEGRPPETDKMQKENPTCFHKSGFLWRRERDSNPRTGISRYTISNRAPSTSSAISPWRSHVVSCVTTKRIIPEISHSSIGFLKFFKKFPLTGKKSILFPIRGKLMYFQNFQTPFSTGGWGRCAGCSAQTAAGNSGSTGRRRSRGSPGPHPA